MSGFARGEPARERGPSADCSPVEGGLRALLAAREERAWLQKYLLGAFSGLGSHCVAQISLNIPGWPKRLSGDERALRAGGSLFLRETADSARPKAGFFLLNAAGAAIIWVLADAGDTVLVKERAVRIEEGPEWGRVLDIDVITPVGPLSRPAAGIAARRCFLCGREAKVCARTQAHPVRELRGEARRLIRLASFEGGG
ncbi:MAG: citrate lyase holo-[acyl-carrier protein] synthase [Synergistaceae bacterium]|jgi:holo-ACP synthase CitX|nr:citrate lyase holo-[acyl-carrier protein] synthase [Synergistaceae bacterium]